MPNKKPKISVAYWNMLFNSPVAQQLAYIDELMKLADVLVLVECTDMAAKQLRKKYKYVDTDERLTFMDYKFGLTVVSKRPLKIKRQSPWPRITYTGKYPGSYDDHRDYVRFEIKHPNIGPVAVYAGHVSHPHHWWRTAINKRRPVEWRWYTNALAAEKLPFLWMADTNTTLAHTVKQRLKLDSIKAVLLPHHGKRTWSRHPKDTKKLLYLDRVAASKQLAGRAQLTTVAGTLNGAVCPSDHRAILTTIA